MSNQASEWPLPPRDELELQKILYTAQVEEIASQRKAERQPPAQPPYVTENRNADWAAERELDKVFQQSMFDVYKESLSRAERAAELVQKAAGAVATIYTGLLALAFSVADNPLAARATVPGLFLGFAVTFSTAYLA